VRSWCGVVQSHGPHQPTVSPPSERRVCKSIESLCSSRWSSHLSAQRHIHFFKDRNVDIISNNCGVIVDGQPCIDLNTRAWSYMGNLIVPIRGRAAAWYPYGTGGCARPTTWG